MGSYVSLDSYEFQDVQHFVYLGTSITNNNMVSIDIKRSYVYICYFGLNSQMSSRALSRRTQLTLYKYLIIRTFADIKYDQIDMTKISYLIYHYKN